MATMSKFQMTKPILKNFKYTLKDEFDRKNLDYDAHLKVNNRFNKHKTDNMAIVGLELVIDDENLPYTIELFIVTNVKWESDVDNDTVERILDKTIPAHLVSYIRPILSLITSYSNYNAFDLPFLDFS